MIQCLRFSSEDHISYRQFIEVDMDVTGEGKALFFPMELCAKASGKPFRGTPYALPCRARYRFVSGDDMDSSGTRLEEVAVGG